MPRSSRSGRRRRTGDLSGYVVGRGRGSGAEIRVPFSQLGWFRDGKVIRIDGFMSREGARGAAGLG